MSDSWDRIQSERRFVLDLALKANREVFRKAFLLGILFGGLVGFALERWA